jgi:DNA-binding response OmpR family regulator
VQVSSARVAFVVHGVEYQIDLSPVRIALICALIAAADDRSDALVGFKSTTSLVQALRARGWAATRRSLTVEVSRLRAALGPANGLLIETRRGAGYRFRMLRAGVPAGGRA